MQVFLRDGFSRLGGPHSLDLHFNIYTFNMVLEGLLIASSYRWSLMKVTMDYATASKAGL